MAFVGQTDVAFSVCPIKKTAKSRPSLKFLLHRHQFVPARAEADLFSVNEGLLPIYMWVTVQKDVVMVVPIRLRQMIAQLAAFDRHRFLTGVNRRLIAGHRVKGDKDAEIRQDGRVISPATVALRRDIHGHVDVEGGASLTYRLGIFGHLAIEDIVGVPLVVAEGVEGTCPDAAAAALTYLWIDDRLVVLVANGRGATFRHTAAAAPAFLHIDNHLARRVLLHLPSPAAAPHA